MSGILLPNLGMSSFIRRDFLQNGTIFFILYPFGKIRIDSRACNFITLKIKHQLQSFFAIRCFFHNTLLFFQGKTYSITKVKICFCSLYKKRRFENMFKTPFYSQPSLATTMILFCISFTLILGIGFFTNISTFRLFLIFVKSGTDPLYNVSQISHF